jgi:hypothetical protein
MEWILDEDVSHDNRQNLNRRAWMTMWIGSLPIFITYALRSLSRHAKSQGLLARPVLAYSLYLTP